LLLNLPARRECWITTVSVPLAGALEDFFTRNGLALPPGHDEDRAGRPCRCSTNSRHRHKAKTRARSATPDHAWRG
jgi:hypothetical protein